MIFSITRDNASPNLVLINEFKREYYKSTNQQFFGDIPCIAHVINLIVQDIMNGIKIKPPKNAEIPDIIREIEKIRVPPGDTDREISPSK